jgi:transposase-like protein
MADSTARPPQAGVDYPRNRIEFGEFFPDEQACVAYLERLRWAGGFVCPNGHVAAAAWRSARGLRVCPTCRCQVSATAGTIFEGTRKLRHWFLAAWEVTSQKSGASALSLQRTLGLGSYETAWSWLHKLRRAMVRPDRDQLAGDVEVDETYLGEEAPGSTGRATIKRAVIVIAVEMNDGQIGRIRLRHVPNVNAISLRGFIVDVVQPGSLIRTDGWQGYAGTASQGFRHRVTVTRTSSEPAHITFPGVHRVASLLKRWWLGTHQGAVSKEHLDYYLDEFTFRFNRRTSKARGLLFYRLLTQAVRTAHVDTDELSRATGRGRRPRLDADHQGSGSVE